MERLELADARDGDCDAIADVHVRAWQAAYRDVFPEDYLASLSVAARARSWRSVLAEGRSDLVVARRGTAVLGFASFGPSRDADAGSEPTGELWALYADPSAWGQGVGRALWLEALGRMQGRGYSKITLWVLDGNRRALAFYQCAGFTRDWHPGVPVERGGATALEIRLSRPATTD